MLKQQDLTRLQNGRHSMRNFFKCDRCRKDHKKCNPDNRNWENGEEKCLRCIELNYDCGPPVRKNIQRRRRRKRIPCVDSPIIGGKAPTTPRAEDRSRSDDHITDASTPVTIVSTIPTCNMSLRLDIDKELEIIMATRRLLLCILTTIMTFVQKRGLPKRFDEVFSVIRRVQKCLAHMFEQMSNPANIHSNSPGVDPKSSLRLSLRFLGRYYRSIEDSNLDKPTDMDVAAEAAKKDAQVWNDVFYFYPEGSEIFSCITHVDILPKPQERISAKAYHSSIDLRCEQYEHLASRIKDVLNEIPDEALDLGGAPDSRRERFKNRKILLHGIPAFHIAVFNKDYEAAVQLWKYSIPDHEPRDVLSRTPLHLAVATRNLDLISGIVGRLTSLNALQTFDIFDLSPLDTAAFIDDHISFGFLQRRFADGKLADSTRDLAVAADSWSVVSLMLNMGLIFPPLSQLMDMAIKHGSLQTAELFLLHLRSRNCHSRAEVVELANRATKHGHKELAAKLQKIWPEFPTVGEASADLDAFEAQFSDQYTADFDQDFAAGLPNPDYATGEVASNERNFWPHG